ncbi:hypothetical protein P4V41_07495 [Fictibacillus nanhaiensis]|uniref:hypothetical protein n=1 Tax=Fictibacillus nanhaiensis TaxID=742169 RepID=UPI002E1DA44E|nr:hypothetical protein [Fictibacillus nanhaiensis]
MTKQEECDHLIEMVARARMLAAQSKSNVVGIMLDMVEVYSDTIVEQLGLTSELFKNETTKRYNEIKSKSGESI